MDALELRSQSEKAAKQTDSLHLDSEAVSKDTSYLFRIWEVKRNCLPGGEEARGPQRGSHRPPRGTTKHWANPGELWMESHLGALRDMCKVIVSVQYVDSRG